MPKQIAYACAAFLLLAAGCHRGQVRLREAPRSDRFVWRDPVPASKCDSYWRDLLLPARPPMGYAEGREKTADTRSLNAKLRWNDSARTLGGMFRLLCARHNEGLISLSEYEQRQTELLRATGQLRRLRKHLTDALESYAAAKQQVAEARAEAGGTARTRTEEARQQLETASENIEDTLEEASDLVKALREPRAEARVIAAALPWSTAKL